MMVRDKKEGDVIPPRQNKTMSHTVFKVVAGWRVVAFGVGADTLGFGYNYYIFMTIIFYFLNIQLSLSNFPDYKDFRMIRLRISGLLLYI